MEIKPKIKEFIINNFLMGADSANIQNDTSFLEEGVIDSTGILELVEFLQETFKIMIEDEELIPDNLDSIDKVAAFILRKQTK
ncbi:MAG: acyl carrier protein [Candidatus Omnitrophica bacterium]|nr:acyl carrier protein [Candidatus Omnitrophota bacterium]